MLRNEASLEIVGEARDGRQAVELVKELKPDVMLMDVSMPDMNGFDATRRVHDFDPDVKVLILTMHDEEELVARCLEAGAAGYIMKDAPASQLLYAIETVQKGERYLSPDVLKKVVDGYVKNTNRPQTSYDRLTPTRTGDSKAAGGRADCKRDRRPAGSERQDCRGAQT